MVPWMKKISSLGPMILKTDLLSWQISKTSLQSEVASVELKLTNLECFSTLLARTFMQNYLKARIKGPGEITLA